MSVCVVLHRKATKRLAGYDHSSASKPLMVSRGEFECAVISMSICACLCRGRGATSWKNPGDYASHEIAVRVEIPTRLRRDRADMTQRLAGYDHSSASKPLESGVGCMAAEACSLVGAGIGSQ